MESISRCGNFPDENHQRSAIFCNIFLEMLRTVASPGTFGAMTGSFFSTAGNSYFFSREKSFSFTLVFFARKGNTSEGKRLFSRGKQCFVTFFQCLNHRNTLFYGFIHCTLYTVHCTLYTVHCTLYTVHCTLYTVHCTLYTVHCTLYTVHCTLYTVHCTHCSSYHFLVPRYSGYPGNMITRKHKILHVTKIRILLGKSKVKIII